MTAAQFKKDSKVTYVLVKGDPCGIVVPASGSAFHSTYSSRRLKYSGYIEVPYSYEDFIALYEQKDFYYLEDDNSFIDNDKDEAYYHYYKK